MRRDESVGLGAIHADDELLDRLARRDDASLGGLEAMLASWTAQIDADAQATADRSGPLGLRRAAGADAVVVPIGQAAARPAPRTIRIPGSRAAAVVGAFAITMSGGGVAAALTGQDVPIMSQIVAKARSAEVMATAPPEALDEAYTTAVGRSVAQGRPDRARLIMQVWHENLPENPDPTVVAQMQALDEIVVQAEIIASAKTGPTPTTVPSVLAGAATTSALGLPSSAALATLMTTTGSAAAPLAPSPSSAAHSTPPSESVAAAPSSAGTDDIDPRGETKVPTSATSGVGASSPAGAGSASSAGTSTPSSSSGGSSSSSSNSSDPSGSSSKSPSSSPTTSDTARPSGVLPPHPRPRPTGSATPSPSRTPTTQETSHESSVPSRTSGGTTSTGSASSGPASSGSASSGSASTGSTSGSTAGVLPGGTLTRGGTTSDRTVTPAGSRSHAAGRSRGRAPEPEAAGSATERAGDTPSSTN